ncbi:MAG: isoamylase early set domain-containing protein [Thermodesulfobacteriota bacterium]
MPGKSLESPRSKGKKVRFEFYAPQALQVSLGGDFNGWDANSLPMKKDKQGTWKMIVPLEPGKYEYRFWVDGVWADDPNVQERVQNPFGSQNCVKIVS